MGGADGAEHVEIGPRPPTDRPQWLERLARRTCGTCCGQGAAMALSQQARVMRLYRAVLKDTLHWVFSRDVWMVEAAKVRQEFEQHKGVTGPALDALLAKGEAKFESERHPNPYIVPYTYGGSLSSRNPPVPKEMKVHMDWGPE